MSIYVPLGFFTLRWLIINLHPEFVDPVVVQPPSSFGGSIVGSLGFNQIFDKILVLFRIGIFHWTFVLTILALIAIFLRFNWKKKMWIFFYPLIFMIVASLAGSFEFYPPLQTPPLLFLPASITYIRSFIWGWNVKIIFSLTPFIIIASASTISAIAEFVSRFTSRIQRSENRRFHLHIQFKKYPRNKKQIVPLFLVFAVLTVQFLPYFTFYGLRSWDPESPNYTVNGGLKLQSQPIVQWVDQNTPKDAVLLGPFARELAWYADRTTVRLGNPFYNDWNFIFETNLTSAEYLIKHYNASYLIMSDDLPESVPLSAFLRNPSNAPPGFTPVFYQSNPLFIIYNVTDIWVENLNVTLRSDLVVSNGTSPNGWKVNNQAGQNSIVVDDTVRNDNESTLRVEGTTGTDGYMLASADAPIKGFDWNSSKYLQVSLKVDPSNLIDFGIQIYDTHNNFYAWNVHIISHNWNDGNWHNILIPISQPQDISKSPLNMTDIRNILFVAYGKPSSYITYYVGECALASWDK